MSFNALHLFAAGTPEKETALERSRPEVLHTIQDALPYQPTYCTGSNICHCFNNNEAT